jgi:hypothetical protein
MEIKKFKIDNMDMEFVNESYRTRNGFKHVSHFFFNGVDMGENTVHYLNRTWECYPYQTCMRGLINKIIEERTEMLKELFKETNGYKIVSASRKEEFEKFLEHDDILYYYIEVRNKI